MPKANKFIPPIDSDLQFMDHKKEKEERRGREKEKEEKVDYWLKVLEQSSIVHLRKLLYVNSKIPPQNLSKIALVAKNEAIKQLIEEKHEKFKN
jgi:hypothetical protein